MSSTLSGQMKVYSGILFGVMLGILIGREWNNDNSTNNSEKGNVDKHVNQVSSYQSSSVDTISRRSKNRRITPLKPASEESLSEEFRRNQIKHQIQALREKSKFNINELTIQLGLSDKQLGHLEKLMTEKLRHYHSELLSQDPSLAIGWRVDMLDLANNLIGEVLTDSQIENFNLLKKRKREAQIEAAALIELSKLSNLILDEDQSLRAFEVFIKKEQEGLKPYPKTPSYQTITEDQVPQVKQTLEETLEQMEGILDPDQLAIYRLQLEMKLGLRNIIDLN